MNPIELLRHIKARRSVFPKDYTGEPVPKEVVQSMLEAANWAPTHGKTEPWRFAVFYGTTGVARVEALKVAATRRALAATPEKLEATLEKMARKAKDVAKCGAIVAIVRKRTVFPTISCGPWSAGAARAVACRPWRRATPRNRIRSLRWQYLQMLRARTTRLELTYAPFAYCTSMRRGRCQPRSCSAAERVGPCTTVQSV